MTQDYARKKSPAKSRNTRQRPTRDRAPGWLWMLAGILLGMLIMALKDLWQTPDSPEEAAPTASAEQSDGDQKPRFDFYTLLRESEILVPDEEPGAPAQAPQAEDQYIYILQTGSFKSITDAESLRVQLLLLNLTASIETVDINPGEKWYRVVVGPLASAEALAEARTRLSNNGIDSLLLKRKKDAAPSGAPQTSP